MTSLSTTSLNSPSSSQSYVSAVSDDLSVYLEPYTREFQDLITRFPIEVREVGLVKNHRISPFKVLKNVITGEDIARWLIDHLFCNSRPQAEKVGSLLMKFGAIESVSGSSKFEPGREEFYRLGSISPTNYASPRPRSTNRLNPPVGSTMLARHQLRMLTAENTRQQRSKKSVKDHLSAMKSSGLATGQASDIVLGPHCPDAIGFFDVCQVHILDMDSGEELEKRQSSVNFAGGKVYREQEDVDQLGVEVYDSLSDLDDDSFR